MQEMYYQSIFNFDKSDCYSLQKNNFYLEIIGEAPIVINDNKGIDYLNLKKLPVNLRVTNFIDKNKKLNPNFDLSTFFKNLETLKIDSRFKIKNLKKIKEKIAAEYDHSKNTVRIFSPYTKYHLTHELYHVATTHIYEYNDYYAFHSGFNQFYSTTGIDLGIAVNEGYTAYIDDKTFGKKSGYIIPLEIIKLISILIDKDKLDELYSKMDLLGLIAEMDKFGLKELFVNILYNSDLMLREERLFYSNYAKKYNKMPKKTVDNIFHYLVLNDLIKLNIFIINKYIKENKISIYDGNKILYNELRRLYDYYDTILQYDNFYAFASPDVKDMISKRANKHLKILS